MPTFSFRSEFPVSCSALFDWHRAPGAFERLNPPWDPVEVLSRTEGIDGGQVSLRVKLGPLPVDWKLEHFDYQEGLQFCDRQLSGPFKSWCHRHLFQAVTNSNSILEDHIEYELPLNISSTLGDLFIEKKLRGLFTFRHAVTKNDLLQHEIYADKPRKHYLISGATGLLGRQLVAFLLTSGNQVTILSRSTTHNLATLPVNTIVWDPHSGRLDLSNRKFDCVIHLAGENVASSIWTTAHKERILSSRVTGTRLLVNALKDLPEKPELMISASAIGYYGSRGEELLTEESNKGEGFLSQTCSEWEQEAQNATEQGIRLAICRFGMLLSPAGGALKKMLPAFRFGLGAVLGSGTQYVSWMHLDDAVYALHFLANNKHDGVFNFVAPTPVSNSEFSKALANVLSRPLIFNAPGGALRAIFAEFAEEALLGSTRAVPNRLLNVGYKFVYPDLRTALKVMLGRTS